jgi:hypothetical protein
MIMALRVVRFKKDALDAIPLIQCIGRALKPHPLKNPIEKPYTPNKGGCVQCVLFSLGGGGRRGHKSKEARHMSLLRARARSLAPKATRATNA